MLFSSDIALECVEELCFKKLSEIWTFRKLEQTASNLRVSTVMTIETYVTELVEKKT